MSKDDDAKTPPKSPPPVPPQDALPPSRMIWSGNVSGITGSKPCRVVLQYKWVLPKDAKEWQADPAYVYEVSETTDAMRQRIYTAKPLSDIPAAFFEAVIAAFDRV